MTIEFYQRHFDSRYFQLFEQVQEFRIEHGLDPFETSEVDDQLGPELQIESSQRLGRGSWGKVYAALVDNKEGFVAKVAQRDKRILEERDPQLEACKEIANLRIISHLACEYFCKYIGWSYEEDSEKISLILVNQRHGESLYSFVKKSDSIGTFDYVMNLTQHIAHQLLEALDALHRLLGMIHQDVSMKNVLIEGCSIRVIDLGSAVSVKIPAEERIDVICDQRIVSPEVRAHFAATTVSDVWAAMVCVLGVFFKTDNFLSLPTQMNAYFNTLYAILGKFPEDPYGQSTSQSVKSYITINCEHDGQFSFFWTRRMNKRWKDEQKESFKELQLKDLASHCFQLDPKQRYTAEQALNHPFFSEGFLDREDLKNSSLREGDSSTERISGNLPSPNSALKGRDCGLTGLFKKEDI